MKKFDLYQELLDAGFKAQENPNQLVKEYHKEVEVCWYGKQDSVIIAEVWFARLITIMTVFTGAVSSRKRFT